LHHVVQFSYAQMFVLLMAAAAAAGGKKRKVISAAFECKTESGLQWKTNSFLTSTDAAQVTSSVNRD